ncbi:hypothetical protein HK103_007020 [Boothiomyces macroporosus]|uniref:RRM domain-containing protein n=1 Tax=Boothiomyces macroporosus TaxID=261099 RepID=A0AAD5UG01_9FUNG|nr:hypothetical protein HK103_007020 [Boothiomyces macroporosus]
MKAQDPSGFRTPKTLLSVDRNSFMLSPQFSLSDSALNSQLERGRTQQQDTDSSPMSTINEQRPSVCTSEFSLNSVKDEDCLCDQDKEATEIHNSMIPMDILTLWKEWLCVPSGGNTNSKFLVENQKIADIMFGPWVPENSPNVEELLPLGQAGGPQYEPEYTSVKEGYVRKSTKSMPLNHGIPFVPKTTQSIETMKITKITEKSLCIVVEATMPLMGIDSVVKLCLSERDSKQTHLKAFAKFVFTGNGKLPVPKMVAEKSAYDGVRNYYNEFASFISENLEQPSGAPASDQECTCITLNDSDGYKTLMEEVYTIPIDVVWKQAFISKQNTVFMNYNITEGGWTGTLELKIDILFEPWLEDGENGELTPLEKMTTPNFTPEFSAIKPGFHRRTKCVVPLKHGIPFVPKTAVTTGSEKILQAGPNSFCVDVNTSVDLGIVNDLRICFTKIDDTKTKLRILIKVTVKSKMIPKGTAEKNTFENVKKVYTDIFSQIEKFVASGQKSVPVAIIQPKPVVQHAYVADMIQTWIQQLPQSYLFAKMNLSLDDAIKTHRKNKPFKKRKHHKNPWSEQKSGGADGHWVVSVTNLHWNVSKEDLIELFGGKEAVSSVSIKFDESGRSLGEAEVTVKSKELAETAKSNLDGQTLDGLIISVNLVRELKKKADITSRLGGSTGSAGGGILERLGKRVEDRLGKRVEDRLGKKVEERLGKKVQPKKKKKNDAMETDPPARQIKSYADTEIAANDGTLV